MVPSSSMLSPMILKAVPPLMRHTLTAAHRQVNRSAADGLQGGDYGGSGHDGVSRLVGLAAWPPAPSTTMRNLSEAAMAARSRENMARPLGRRAGCAPEDRLDVVQCRTRS